MGVLVTGGAGFIGSWVSKALLEQGEEVILIDDFNDFNYKSTLKDDRIRILLNESKYRRKKRYHSSDKKLWIYHADIRDEKKLRDIAKQHKIEKICHLGARAGVRRSLQYPKVYYDVNIFGTLNVFQLAVQQKIPSLVYASSSSVYGGVKELPFKETMKIDNPLSPYAATKKAGEEMAAVFHNLYGINMTGLRFFTVYGPWGRPDMALYEFTEKIIAGKPIPVYNQGDMQRDFTYVTDTVDGIVSASQNDKLVGEVVNIAYGKERRINEVAQIVLKTLGKTHLKIIYQEKRPGDVKRHFADTKKAKKLLKFSAKIPLEKGIARYIEWLSKEKIDTKQALEKIEERNW